MYINQFLPYWIFCNDFFVCADMNEMNKLRSKEYKWSSIILKYILFYLST